MHRPAKRKPKPALAWVAQEAPAKVAARPTLTRLMLLIYKINQRFHGGVAPDAGAGAGAGAGAAGCPLGNADPLMDL